MNNIYWPVFKNIESEINNLMFNIHFDDSQLNVYSSKISDLILRASTEIESLSKELYHKHGGVPKDKLSYDKDCLSYLNKKWNIEKKQVIISSYNCFFTINTIEPFRKNIISNFTKKLTYGWNNAYQNLKHDRSKSLEFGSVRNLLDVVAALFILNIYYKDEIIHLGNDSTGNNFDASLGSIIFNLKIYIDENKNIDNIIIRNNELDSCIYVLRYTDDSIQEVNNSQKEIQMNRLKEVIFDLSHENFVLNNKSQLMKNMASENFSRKLFESYQKLQNEAVLNKNQFIQQP